MIHFSEPFKHAAHYRGWTKDAKPDRRFEQHRAGQGARLIEVVLAAGISIELVRVWPNKDRRFERNLKGRAIRDICPKCKAALEEEALATA